MKNYFEQLIGKNFKVLSFYYGWLKFRLLILLLLNISVGILDGFGLAMFLPLLQQVSGNGDVSTETLGNLGFIVRWFKLIGIDVNLLGILMVMVFFFVFKGLFKFFSSYYRILVQQFFIRRLRINLLNGFIGLKFKEFVKSDVGRIQNSLGIEIERVSKSFLDYFRAIEQGVLVLVYMCFAFLIDIKFASLVSIGGLLTNSIFRIFYNKTRVASTTFSIESHKFQGLMIQMVTNFKYMKATGLLRKYFNKIVSNINIIEISRKKMGFMAAIMEAMREPILIIIVAAVMLFQAQVLGAPLGPVLISLLFFYRALSALVGMQNSWNTFLATSGSLNNVINLKESMTASQESYGNEVVNGINSDLVLKNVGLIYEDVVALKGIHLNIQNNETIAIVGESGSGKTSLVSLISGLITPTDGLYMIDGRDSAELDMRSIQKRIGYVSQEPVIFSDTILNNITFWDEQIPKTKFKFEQALKMASLYEFVNGLKDREHTLLGNNGVNLSGGQKQRISIARELYKDIDILIMDEATSALDSETERAVQENIELLKGKYTIIIIAHRLSTIRHADKIVLLDNGHILKTGSFNELLDLGEFKKMVELQEL